MKTLLLTLALVAHAASLPAPGGLEAWAWFLDGPQVSKMTKDANVGKSDDVIEQDAILEKRRPYRPMNIVQLAKELGCNHFVDHLDLFPDLDEVLRSKGPLTAFIPTDEAFVTFNRDRREHVKHKFQDIFNGHITRGRIYTSQMHNELISPSLLVWDGETVNLRFNKYKDGKAQNVLTATGSRLTVIDQDATNGVVHVVNRIIYPQALYNIVVQMAQTHNSTGMLLAAIEVAGLADVLIGADPFTMFAPSNKAFREMKNPSYMDLMSDQKSLKAVLMYHLVSGTIFEAGLQDGPLTTLSGEEIMVKTSDKEEEEVRVNLVEIEVPDVAVKNGVFHIMYGVMIPPTVRAAYQKQNNLD